MDDTYQNYVNRVARLTLPDSYISQIEHIQESPKFIPLPTGGKTAAPFPGYSVITPPGTEDPENGDFYQSLDYCQQQLSSQLDPGLFIPLPPKSFHLTVADLIWDSAYRDASQHPEFDHKLQACINQSFQTCHSALSCHQPVRLLVLGLIVMTRAIAISLMPTSEQGYDQIIQVRRSIYQNPDLMSLGIEQQYHLTAHITLGYFGQIPDSLDRQQFCNVLLALNEPWLQKPQEFVVKRAELRKFQDMTCYERQPDWPVLEFTG